MKKKYQIVATAMAATMAVSAAPMIVLAEEAEAQITETEIREGSSVEFTITNPGDIDKIEVTIGEEEPIVLQKGEDDAWPEGVTAEEDGSLKVKIEKEVKEGQKIIVNAYAGEEKKIDSKEITVIMSEEREAKLAELDGLIEANKDNEKLKDAIAEAEKDKDKASVEELQKKIDALNKAIEDNKPIEEVREEAKTAIDEPTITNVEEEKKAAENAINEAKAEEKLPKLPEKPTEEQTKAIEKAKEELAKINADEIQKIEDPNIAKVKEDAKAEIDKAKDKTEIEKIKDKTIETIKKEDAKVKDAIEEAKDKELAKVEKIIDDADVAVLPKEEYQKKAEAKIDAEKAEAEAAIENLEEKDKEEVQKKIAAEATKAKEEIAKAEDNKAIQEIKDKAVENIEKIVEEATKKEDGKKPSSNGSSSKVITSVSRIAGNDRVQTAIKLSKKEFGTAKTVILADKSNFADALTASTLASKNKAPILLVDKNALNKDVKAEIQRLGAKDVIIVGGTNSVGSAVEKAVKDDLKLAVKRLAGADRYATSKAIAEEIFKLTGKRDKAVIASGQVFADALSVSPFAIEKNMPIILVNKNAVPKDSKEALKDVKEVYIAGGENTVTKDVEKNLPKVVQRFAGADRYETSANIAKETYSSPYTAYVSSGQVFADALVVGPVAAKSDAPILLVEKNKATKYTLDYLKSKSVRQLKVVGGENSINSSVEKELEKAK